MDFDTVKDRLSCPHTSSCRLREPIYEITAASKEGMLSLDVECQSCHGKDHLMFDVNEYDRSSQLQEISVGDELIVKDSDTFMLNKDDQIMVTAIADNPLYTSESIVVGVIVGIDSSPPYRGKLFQIDTFEKLLSNESIEKLKI